MALSSALAQHWPAAACPGSPAAARSVRHRQRQPAGNPGRPGKERRARRSRRAHSSPAALGLLPLPCALLYAGCGVLGEGGCGDSNPGRGPTALASRIRLRLLAAEPARLPAAAHEAVMQQRAAGVKNAGDPATGMGANAGLPGWSAGRAMAAWRQPWPSAGQESAQASSIGSRARVNPGQRRAVSHQLPDVVTTRVAAHMVCVILLTLLSQVWQAAAPAGTWRAVPPHALPARRGRRRRRPPGVGGDEAWELPRWPMRT